MLSIIGVIVAVMLWAQPASAGSPCTRGFDCYCDRVRTNASVNGLPNIFDSSLLMCEDFEAPTLVSDVNRGGGAPNYGPPYDDTGFTGNRGFNSYWMQAYTGGTVNNCGWSQNQPSPATVGAPCAFPSCGGGVWHPTNLWQANNFACLAFLQSGQFGIEVPSIGAGPGVFDGAAVFGQRIPAGSTQGITGNHVFPGGPQRTFGVTAAIAYPSNVTNSSIWTGAWKHNEWHTPPPPGQTIGAGGDGLFLFHNQAFLNSQDPFHYNVIDSLSSLGYPGGDTQATCNTKLAAATKTVGDFLCDNGGNFYFGAAPAVYTRSADWPDNNWGCVRAFYQNLGTANSSIQMWFTGPAGVEKKIIDISNMDMTGMSASTGYDYFIWNAYANANQPGGGTPTSQTTFRYEDNWHVRAGAPVSCAQIGFGGTAITVPGTPTNLTVN